MSPTIEQLCVKLDEQIRGLENLPHAETREQVFTILQLIDQLHRDGIRKIAETFADHPDWNRICQSPEVDVLLTFYANDETDETERVEQTPGNLVQLRVNAPVFETLMPFDELPETKPTVVDLQGNSVVLARSGNEISCFDPTCRSCGGSFTRGMVRGPIIMCDRSNCAYDFRTGRQVDGGDSSLRIYPVSIRNGSVAVAVNFKPATMPGKSS